MQSPANQNPSPNTSQQSSVASATSRTVRYPYLQHALKMAYRQYSKLPMPLVGGSFPIQEVSLTINIKEKQQERELTQNEVASLPQKNSQNQNPYKVRQESYKEFGRHQLEREAAWHKIEKPVAVADMFKAVTDESKNDKANVSPPEDDHRILVEGRAGVGKTTLLLFIARQWATQGLFAQDYDYVLWVPLRQWLSGQPTEETTFTEDLAAFLFERYLSDLPNQTTTQQLNELMSILDAVSERTLLILDGYDEVAHHLNAFEDTQPTLYNRLLRQALKFKNLLLTTRDYQLPPSSISFDKTLVNIGFTDTQIKQYVHQYDQWLSRPSLPQMVSVPLQDKENPVSKDSSLFTMLHGNAQLWALCHIPLNLALLCQTYGNSSDQTSTQRFDQLSLTQLYQDVLKNFLLRQLQKEGKSLPKMHYLSVLKKKFIVEWDVLSTLAWEGFQEGQVVVSPATQEKVFYGLESQYSQVGDFDRYFSHALDLGFMRNENPSDPTGRNQPRYFIHLTFQEYFTAQYLADNLQGYRGEAAFEAALVWISENKYDAHAAVVIEFISGITAQPSYEQAFLAFWYVILSPPYELNVLNGVHLQLLFRCLAEAHYKENIPNYQKIITEISQWIEQLRSSNDKIRRKVHSFLLNLHSSSIILKNYTLPILFKWYGHKDNTVYDRKIILESLVEIAGKVSSQDQEKIVDFWVRAFTDKPEDGLNELYSLMEKVSTKHRTAVLSIYIKGFYILYTDIYSSRVETFFYNFYRLAEIKILTLEHQQMIVDCFLKFCQKPKFKHRSTVLYVLEKITEKIVSQEQARIFNCLVQILLEYDQIQFDIINLLIFLIKKVRFEKKILLDDQKKIIDGLLRSCTHEKDDIRLAAFEALDKLMTEEEIFIDKYYSVVVTACLQFYSDSELWKIQRALLKLLANLAEKVARDQQAQIIIICTQAYSSKDTAVKRGALSALEELTKKVSSEHHSIIVATHMQACTDKARDVQRAGCIGLQRLVADLAAKYFIRIIYTCLRASRYEAQDVQNDAYLALTSLRKGLEDKQQDVIIDNLLLEPEFGV